MKVAISGNSRLVLGTLIVVQLVAIICFLYGNWVWTVNSTSGSSGRSSKSKTSRLLSLSWADVFHVHILSSPRDHAPSRQVHRVHSPPRHDHIQPAYIRRQHIASPRPPPHSMYNKVNQSTWRDHHSLLHPQMYDLTHRRQHGSSYFLPLSPPANRSCFIYGTDMDRSITTCACWDGWYGSHCGIPDTVYLSSPTDTSTFNITDLTPRLRSHARLVIQAFIVNHEYHFFETRLHELYDVVDVFLMLESNYSMYGEPKKLNFHERLNDGYMSEYQDKIVYVFLDHFPENGFEDGWLTDAYLRNYLGKEGVKRLRGTRPDDLIVYTDADEIPRREVLLFLKLYDGYPEPIALRYRWSYYGFFWAYAETWDSYSVCTLAMLRYVYKMELYRVRKNDFDLDYARVNTYMTSGSGGGARVAPWMIGTRSYPAGWHCSWCFTPQGIRTKLVSAINADFPRWGDYPHKRNLTYIRALIRDGAWFDGSNKFADQGGMSSPRDDPFYAPQYILEHPDRFRYLIDNIYVPEG